MPAIVVPSRSRSRLHIANARSRHKTGDATSVCWYKTALAILQMHQYRWNMSTRIELVESWKSGNTKLNEGGIYVNTCHLSIAAIGSVEHKRETEFAVRQRWYSHTWSYWPRCTAWSSENGVIDAPEVSPRRGRWRSACTTIASQGQMFHATVWEIASAWQLVGDEYWAWYTHSIQIVLEAGVLGIKKPFQISPQYNCAVVACPKISSVQNC